MNKKFTVYTLLTILSCTSFLHAQIPTEGLTFYFPFNGNALDESTNGNNTFIYGASLISDRFGNAASAYSFDGIDDYITISPVSDLDSIGDFTLSIWYLMDGWGSQSVNDPSVLDHQYVFNGHCHSATTSSDFNRDGININFWLYADSTYHLRNATINTSGNSYAVDIDSITDFMGQWHHNVFVREGTQTYHYIDGVLVTSEYNDGAVLNMQHDLWIGTVMGNNPNYSDDNYNFDGSVDDLRFYQEALTSEEVADLFTESNPVSTGIESMDNLSSLKVYPNPARNYVIISNDDNIQMSEYKLIIVNTLGQTVFENLTQQLEFRINVNEFGGKGSYFIKIYDSEGLLTETRKLIVQ